MNLHLKECMNWNS